MEKNGVQTRVTFAGNITRHPAFREYLDDFENADRIMKDGFLLGAHHGMTIEDVDRVCELLKKFAEYKLKGRCSLM
jgi:CDP-6-deoxy-D-xylo-4-hexulose-3-dehydrase